MRNYSKNYSLEILNLQKNTYFLGKFISGNTRYFIAEDNINSQKFESFENDLTSELETNILRVSKNCRIEQIQEEDDIFLLSCFEYPGGSNKTFSINRSSFSYYNSMYLFKESFSYPFEFLGNDGAICEFQSTTGLTNFITSALTRHQQVYNSKYLTSVNSVNDVTVTTNLYNAVTSVFNIEY